MFSYLPSHAAVPVYIIFTNYNAVRVQPKWPFFHIFLTLVAPFRNLLDAMHDSAPRPGEQEDEMTSILPELGTASKAEKMLNARK